MKKILGGIGVLLIPLVVMLLGNWRMEAYYNQGNEYYELGEYQNAIGKYEAALQWYPLEKQECSIRINLALSMIQTIDFEQLETKEDAEEAIQTLEDAKQVLLEKGCAVDEEGETGHSDEAQELKEDIDEMIQKLKDSMEEQSKDSDGEEETEESEETEETGETEEESLSDEEIQDIEVQLEKIEQQGYEDRYDELQEAYEWTNGNGWYYYDGITW